MNITGKKIETKEDFVSFVYGLSNNYREHPESWSNDNIGTYLEALAAWVEDKDGYYLNQGQPVPEKPDWQTITDMLFAAKYYE